METHQLEGVLGLSGPEVQGLLSARPDLAREKVRSAAGGGGARMVAHWARSHAASFFSTPACVGAGWVTGQSCKACSTPHDQSHLPDGPACAAPSEPRLKAPPRTPGHRPAVQPSVLAERWQFLTTGLGISQDRLRRRASSTVCSVLSC